MATIIRLVGPGALLLQPGAKEKPSPAKQKEKVIQLSSIGESEKRLWESSARAARPRAELIELLVSVLFLTVALVAAIDCFVELSRLLQSDAIEQVAQRARSAQ